MAPKQQIILAPVNTVYSSANLEYAPPVSELAWGCLTLCGLLILAGLEDMVGLLSMATVERQRVWIAPGFSTSVRGTGLCYKALPWLDVAASCGCQGQG